MASKKISKARMLALFLCLGLVCTLITPYNAYAAKKVIGLVSEQEYQSKYTNTEDYTAVPYYRYATRTKQTTTSGYSSLSGWTQSGKKLVSSSAGSWSRSAGKAGTSRDNNYETVTKVTSTTGYEYYVWVCAHKTWFWKNNGAVHNNGTCRSKNKLIVYSSKGTIGSKDSDGSYTAPKSFSISSPGSFSTIYGMTWNGSSISSWTSGSKITPIWRGGTVTYYKTTVEKYQYSYWKWSDWSSWSDWTATVKSTDDTCKKDSTVMYYVTDIRKEKQTISGSSSYNVKCGDSDFSLGCSTNGDSVLSYSSSDNNVASVNSSGYVSVKGAGTAIITVKAPVTENFYAAEKMIQVTVSKKNQTISGRDTYSATYGSEGFSIDATAQTSLTYSTSNAGVADVDSSGYVTINGGGSAIITVTAAASDVYNSANKTISINVGKASQTISAQDKYDVNYGDEPFYLDAESESGKFKYKSSNKKVATVSSDGKVTLKGLGKAKIYITAVSDSDYKDAKKTVQITVKLKAPELESNVVGSDDVVLTWDKVKGASGYKIVVLNGGKQKSKVTKSRKATFKNIYKGEKYTFKVRAYKIVNNKKVYSSYSNKVVVEGE